MKKYYQHQGCEEESHQTYLELDNNGNVLKQLDIRPDSSQHPITSTNVELTFPYEPTLYLTKNIKI